MKQSRLTEARAHALAMTPEILRLLNETSMTTEEIAKQLKVSDSTVHRRASEAGIDLIKRSVRLGIRKYKERVVTRKYTSSTSHLPETLTGDGRSLEWLSKEWK